MRCSPLCLPARRLASGSRRLWLAGLWVGALAGAGCAEAPEAVAEATGPLDLVASFEAASSSVDVVEIDLGTPASRRLLGHGWARNGQGPDRDFVWGLGESSQLRVGLSHPGNVAITLNARPYGDETMEGQTVTLVANDREFATVALEAGWSEQRVVAPRGLFVDGENTLELRYAWSAVPSELSDSSDTRALAVAFDRLVFDPDAPGPGAPDDRPRLASLDFGSPGSRAQLLGGWGGREQGPQGTSFSWATRRRARAVLELGRPVGSVLSMRARPFAFPGAPEQSVEVAINGAHVGSWRLSEGWQEYSAELPATALQSGRNTVSFTFDQVHSPAEVGVGTDSRTLAAAVDWLTLAPLEGAAVDGGGALHLPLGVRTSYPLTLPPSSVLTVEMADQEAVLVVEIKAMRGVRREAWTLQGSGELALSGPDEPARKVQLTLLARRGTGSETLVLDALRVDSSSGEAATLSGLRRGTPASGDDPPGSR